MLKKLKKTNSLILLQLLFIYSDYSFSLKNENKINVFISALPPLMIKKNNKVDSGILYDIVLKIFNQSNLNYEISEVPITRAMIEIKKNKEIICYAQTYKNKEREKFGIFSYPFFKDDKIVIVFRKDDKKIFDNYSKLEEILKNNNLKILLRKGSSYGTEADKLLKKYKNYDKNNTTIIDKNTEENAVTTVDSNIMYTQLIYKRADYLLGRGDTANYMLQNNKDIKIKLEMKYLKDLTKRHARYFLCSKRINKNSMKKINNAIKNIVKFN